MPTENKPAKASKLRAKKAAKPLIERMAETLVTHPVAASLLSCLFVVGVVVLIFWFTIFSGLDASADFVYSQF